jgi:hypothetical protein
LAALAAVAQELIDAVYSQDFMNVEAYARRVETDPPWPAA